MDNETLQRMAHQIIECLPEDSPLRPYIKDDDAALMCIILALLFWPADDMKRIAQEMLQKMEASDG